eukprot:5978756-Alexandrium_andersonii.AAC.1
MQACCCASSPRGLRAVARRSSMRVLPETDHSRQPRDCTANGGHCNGNAVPPPNSEGRWW